MKRIGIGIIAALILVSGGWTSVQASANDFTVSKFEADYYLGSDAEARSTLNTVERITAEFPAFNQNHGIERVIPKRYEDHPVSLRVQSVTDDQKRPLAYSTRQDGDNEILRIGDADTYVHGSRTYVVTYMQRDVTQYFANTGRDEFYWDINGTGWQQPFGEVTARIHLSDSVKPTLTDKLSCYQGTFGATAQCAISSDGSTITATATNLPAGGNMTVAVGFTAGTFRAYEPSAFEKLMAVLLAIWVIVAIVSTIIGIILIVLLAVRYSRISNRSKDLGTIVPEYIPPKEASVLASEQIGQGTRAGMTAQLIDLAVRHYLKIYQTKEKSLWKSAEYELEITKKIDDLRHEEKQLIETLFGNGNTSVGARFAMKSLKSNYSTASKLQSNTQALVKNIKAEYGLRHKDEVASRWFKRIGWWTGAIAIVTLSPVLFIAALVAFICGAVLYPLTDKGLNLRRYLLGLKLYISVAEEERLKMLQSPEGAEKVGAGVADGNPKQLVKLYERVLPYAVLFGQEQEWNKQLGAYYEQNGSNPDWYSGNAVFNAAVFSSVMSDFGTTTSSYAASTSSSSGGSDGGGSSGGGGGGGGGGGW